MTSNATLTAPSRPQSHVLVDGRLTITRLRPGDTETVHAVFDQLSLTSVWLRFQTGMPCLTDKMATHLASVATGRHEVVVAELDGRPVGLSRWVRDPSNPASVEVAVEVADAVQGRGIGRRLLDATVASARAAGAQEVVAYVHQENRSVITWLHRLGAVAPMCLEDPYRLRLTPAPEPPSCGCMTPCESGCSDPCGSRSIPGSRRPGVLARAISWPSSWRAAVARSRPRPSSTSSGVRRPSA